MLSSCDHTDNVAHTLPVSLDLLPAILTANDAVIMINQELRRQFVEIDVQGFAMLAVRPAVIRGTPYVAPARPTSAPRNDIEASGARSNDSNMGLVAGAAAGGLALIVLVAVLVARKRRVRYMA